MEDLRDMSPNYPLPQFMEQFGYSDSKLINVYEPAWLIGLNEIYTEAICLLRKSMVLLEQL